MIIYMPVLMGYREHRIPERSSLRAPPPPKRFEAPQPEYLKPKRVTRVTINRSQLRSAIAMIILVIFFIIIIYIATTQYTSPPYKRVMKENINMYSFKFSVPDVLSQEVPVSIDVRASSPVELYIVKEKNFDKDMSIIELRNLSIKSYSDLSSHFIYNDELEPGQYFIVSYLRFEENQEISLTIKMTRYFLMPVLWLISLIFILLITLCVVRIFLLQRKKSILRKAAYAPQVQGTDHDYYAERYDYQSAHHDYYDDGSGYHQDYVYPPTPRHYRAPPSRGRTYGSTATQQPQRPRYYSIPQEPPRAPVKSAPRPVTVPCKCSEIIIVNDASRPLRIQCPRCGRRGVLESAGEKHEEDIFY